jgi:BTB/POZ domain
MAKIVRFNMGGIVYTVSYSFLFETHPHSRIAQIASEQLQSSPDDDVVLELDEDRLKFVLEYLQGKGHVVLPRTVPKAVYLAHLFYYGITNVDESKIT